ncbi:MAG: class beta-lactamase-related serine hydrolase [Herbinix sp.]|jgi:hypothetical protein|nr:class beta-lactamase-related serine hydrolase [Herbinix sp.]
MEEFQFKYSTPERQGVKSEAIINFLNKAEQVQTKDMDQEFHSFMMLRHGYVIAEGWWEPYQRNLPHSLFSLSKSFTSTAIGYAVTEGLLSVEDFVVSYFTEECPNPSGYLAQMRIKDLLSMSTGHVVDTTHNILAREDHNWVKAFLEIPVEKEPGTYFLYNTGATYMLSVILQRLTGQMLIDYLRPRFFEPLGIKNPSWAVCPMGYNTGGFGLSLSTEDIAKMGLLYINQGVWNGKQLLPKEWIWEATSFQITNGDVQTSDWCQGYGYQFWQCRHESYRGDGAFGQYCIVMPKEDVVLAITGGMKDMQLTLDIIWDSLLSGIMDEELPDSPQHKLLVEKLSSLKVPMPLGNTTSKLIPDISEKEYAISNSDRFDSVRFEFYDDKLKMTLGSGDYKQTLDIGVGYWAEGYMQHLGSKDHVMFSGIWEDETTLLIQCRYIETPYAVQYRFVFENGQVRMESTVNVSFGVAMWDEMLGINDCFNPKKVPSQQATT